MKRTLRQTGRRQCFWSCFTLLELLLVIAVIMIISAILMPALKTAREQSRRISCANTMSQIGKGFCMYTQDNNDYLPPYRDYGSPIEHYWYRECTTLGLISEYLGLRDPSTTVSIGSMINISGVVYKSKFLCPSLARIPASGSVERGYGYSTGAFYKRMTKFRKITATCLLSEGTASYVTYYTTSGAVPMEFRHLQGVNVIFADIHAEWRKVRQIPDQTYDSGAQSSEFWKAE